MNAASVVVFVIAGTLLWRLPRAWAVLPFLAAGTFIPASCSVEFIGAHFTPLRLLATLALIRSALRHETLAGGWNRLDTVVVCWGACAIGTSLFHEEVIGELVLRMGLCWDCLGTYFVIRILIQDLNDLEVLCRAVVYVLLPVALEMLAEALSGTDRMMALFGGGEVLCEVRDGKIRANGPFLHSILAGTVGACCFPLSIVLWQTSRRLAVLGMIATATMVLTSRSSGPIMTLGAGLIGLFLWKWRARIRIIQLCAIGALVALALVMNAPVYYILARIDLTGSSTSYFRAALIESAINHLGEWWFAGTDYTRDWMASGVAWNAKHTDITNYYIKMGVMGGLPLLLLFLGILRVGFMSISSVMHREDLDLNDQFAVWSLGAILFAHCTTFLSVTYFDQTVAYLYALLAVIGSLGSLGRGSVLSGRTDEGLSYSGSRELVPG